MGKAKGCGLPLLGEVCVGGQQNIRERDSLSPRIPYSFLLSRAPVKLIVPVDGDEEDALGTISLCLLYFSSQVAF